MAAKRRTRGSRASRKPQDERRKKLKAQGPEPEETRSEELLDMKQAIELLKTTRATFYRWLRAGKIRGMKLGRQWRFYREDIERFLKGQTPRVDLPVSMEPLIEMLRTRLEEAGGTDPTGADMNDVQRAVHLTVALGVAMGASDLHITAHLMTDLTEAKAALRCRVDGVLHLIAEIDLRLVPALMEEWKRMAACDVHEKRLPQDGRVVFKLPPTSDDGKERTIDLRVSFVPSALSESMTARVLDPSVVCLDLERLGHAPGDREVLEQALGSPRGMVVVAGPTGCGKTTTLYCCINRLACPEIKVMSVENPVEYFLPWVTQISVNEAAGLTFPRGIVACLRSAPNVIVIGELRDEHVAELAQKAAVTGHLVLAAIHAGNAALALRRMLDLSNDPFLVYDATRLVTSQRLVRLLCPDCNEPAEPEPGLLDRAADLARQGGVDPDSLPTDYRRAVGCPKCHDTGYRGRTLIAEMLPVARPLHDAIIGGASADELRSAAVDAGMTTLAADGVRRAAEGQTTLAEVLRVALA
jgi:excisionase family DNA binding protein